jgi:hypothetical protein
LRVSDLDWQGNLLVVGVLGDTYPDYAFAYDTSQTNVLRKIARFRPADAVHGDNFGWHVAAYGSTAVVSAPDQNDIEGAAYVYSCGANSCVQTQKILAPNHDNAAREVFGFSLDMNGTYLVIGAPNAYPYSPTEDVPTRIGAAYVYTKSGNAWTEMQELHPTDDSVQYNAFGTDLTIQGSRLLFGAPGGEAVPAQVFEYLLSGGLWSARAVLHSDSPNGSFGSSTSLIGQHAIVSAPKANPSDDIASIFFFELP